MTISRRNFLKALGAGSAALAQARALPIALADRPSGALMPVSATERDPTHHAIDRLTFGPTASLVDRVAASGASAFIEEQLAPEGIDDAALAPYIQGFSDLYKSAGQLFEEYEQEIGPIAAQLIGNWVIRALYSQRQLYERMVHFWSDHFSIFVSSGILYLLKVDNDRDAIRAHAMGRFRDLLGAVAHSPAMLVYLDNATSTYEAPNENFARELLELHTLGVDGGYTEDDVKEVARCFTGWTVARPRGERRLPGQGEPGSFWFNPRMHDDGPKTVLGHQIPAGGRESDGEAVLDILAQHPSTARFVCTKLVRRFVADDPPAEIVDVCAATFAQTDGDIRAVLRTLFQAPGFWEATPKFKRPFEYTISILRALNFNIEQFRSFAGPFRGVMLNMGHLPFNRSSPDGYPDRQEEWDDNLLTRWNIAIAAAHGGIPGATASILPLLEAKAVPLEAEPIIRFLGAYFYGRELSSDELQVVMAYINSGDSDEVERLQDGIALLLAAPAFQYR
ncbi:MAG: DUF1800 domain-containing protein [Chloroflexi bacterium]|nr:DUF1800 domain-containing protein [Chloroflexota bacterium]